jgi:hypothetical protein
MDLPGPSGNTTKVPESSDPGDPLRVENRILRYVRHECIGMAVFDERLQLRVMRDFTRRDHWFGA